VTGGQPPSNAMVALNQLTVASGAGGQQGASTVKRRKKSTAQPNPKKMFEEVLKCSVIPYILESNPHPFYSFRGLKNQMRIRIKCGLDSRSRAAFWKNDRAGVLTFFRLRRWQKLDAN
jgi:hypothetical protein